MYGLGFIVSLTFQLGQIVSEPFTLQRVQKATEPAVLTDVVRTST